MRKLLATIAIVTAGIFGVSGAAYATAVEPSVTKYDTQFIYHGEGNWTLVNTGNLTSLHVIGNPQSWLCSYNNVGAGIEPCVPGGSYDFVDHTTNNGLACAYVQADAPVAWDTVPGDPTKAVCLPEPEEETSTPTEPATEPPTSVPPTPTSTPTSPPSSENPSTPTPTTTPGTTPTDTPTTPTTTSTSSETPTTSKIESPPTAASDEVSQRTLAATGQTDTSGKLFLAAAIITLLGVVILVTKKEK